MSRQQIFAERLRRFIAKNNLERKTQENLKQISVRLGIDHLWLRRAVTKGLRHRTHRTDQHLLPLCDDLGITPESLFLESPDWTVNHLTRHLIQRYPTHYYVALAYYESLDQQQALRSLLVLLHERIDLDHCPTIDHEAQLFCKWVNERFTIHFEDHAD